MTKYEKKQKRKKTWKAAIAIIISFMMIVMAISPIFALSLEEEAKIDAIIDVIKKDYYRELSHEEIMDSLYKGMLEKLDPHSTYMTADEYQDFLRSDVVGIGAYVQKESKYIKIINPIEHSPAMEAGLQPGDYILSVNGINLIDMTLDEAVKRIRGEEGTEAVLVIRREGEEDKEYKIIRRKVEIISLKYKLLPSGTGYMDIDSFDDKTHILFDEAMAYFEKNHAKKLIIDLRDNGGGYLSTVLHIADYFGNPGSIILKILEQDKVKKVYYAGQNQNTWPPAKKPEKTQMEVRVLVNKWSASASEILAGVIQTSGAGKVVGKDTYGKGTVQNLMGFTDGNYIKITTSEYSLVKDGVIKKVNNVGITPDVYVEQLDQLKEEEVFKIMEDSFNQ